MAPRSETGKIAVKGAEMPEPETTRVRRPRPHPPKKHAPASAPGRPWMPGTTVGRWAVGLTAVAGVSMLVGLVPGDILGRGFGGALNFGPLGMVAGFAGAASAVVALFRRGDRTILVWLALVPAVLISLFWLAFIVAEIVSPHD